MSDSNPIRALAKCYICKGVLWVCENHHCKPWDEDIDGGCMCGAGQPCVCNPNGEPISSTKVLWEYEIPRKRKEGLN